MSERYQIYRVRNDVNSLSGKIGYDWYVNSAVTASGNGKTRSTAFKTIAEAVAAASAGDRLHMRGTFTEALTCSKQLAFIGAGLNVNDCVWMESAAGDTLLTLTGKGCLIENIRFRVPTTGGIGINMTNSDYTIIRNCHFQGRSGSYYGIRNTGGSQCQITDNVFQYLNTATYGCAILGHTYTSVIPSGWIIKGNLFHSNLKHIQMVMRQSLIEGNFFQEKGIDADNVSVLTATKKLDLLTGSSGGQLNTVTKNIMQGDYSITGGYAPATSDNWFGNISDDVAEAEVYDDGTTTAVPAA
jgi:hypothetical protein